MIGSSLNQYRITASLGAGGMGEVYRAQDTRLHREVAVKVLPKDFVADADRLRRFEQEAKTLAALNHPNILTIHDAGVHEGAPYLVSELLRGHTLREEMNGAALPVRKATDYARQIAQGLAAAHDQGVVHRDLKPENLFVTQDGRMKILDFGLAKLRAPSPPLSPGEKGSEAATVRIDAEALLNRTEPGLVLGTPAYMSPEQVRGEPADHRADLFAFGAVLYEMLSGARAFRRETPVASLNAVLSEEPPDLSGSQADIPPALERVLRRCLEKQPDNRFQSAKDLAFAIDVASTASRNLNPAGGPTSRRFASRQRVAVSLGVIVVAFCGGLLTHQLRAPARPATAPSIRYLTYSGRDYSPAASADGKRICFSSDRNGMKQIWVKDLVTGTERALTDGPDDFPRFSRDDSMILFTRAFGVKRALLRVPSLGGEPSKVVEDVVSGDWSPDGRQVAFVRWADEGSSLHIAGLDGGAQKLMRRFQFRGTAARWSSDGTTIAVSINDSSRPQSIALVNVATATVRTLTAPHAYNLLSSAVWDRRNQNLLYLQADSGSANSSGSTAALFRQSARSGKIQKLLWSPTHGKILDVLPNGNIVMDARSPRENLRELAIGNPGVSRRSLTLGNSTDRQPAYAPDGTEVVFSSNRSGNLELWSVHRKTGLVRRLTDDPADDWDPAYSPDGKRLVWSANRSGNYEIWMAHADGTAPIQLTRDGFAAENPTMTRDGQWVVYTSTHPEKAGVWKIRADGTLPTQLCSSTTAGNAEVSPDGKHAAYVDSKSTSVVYIKVVEIDSGVHVPFQIPVELRKETSAILGRVRWMPDGKSLVFLGQDEQGVNGLYVQDFVPGQDTASSRRPLGPGPFDPENSAESFGISPDGQSVSIAAWEQFFSIMETQDLSAP